MYNPITNNITCNLIKKYPNQPKIVCSMIIRDDISLDIVLTYHQYITYLKAFHMLSKLPHT